MLPFFRLECNDPMLSPANQKVLDAKGLGSSFEPIFYG
jgi:hypothetical protein